MNDCTFDPKKHEYRIRGRLVPSVTQVLSDLVPGWKASDFFLGKGRAVHAAAAMVARGITFEHDARITGQVAALRKFFLEVKPEILSVETQVYSPVYLYGGTYDLIAEVNSKRMIFDYKSALTNTIPIQLAAYALALPKPNAPSLGIGVELRGDGTYMLSETYQLKRYQQEFLALLGAYKIRQRFGLTSEDGTE